MKNRFLTINQNSIKLATYAALVILFTFSLMLSSSQAVSAVDGSSSRQEIVDSFCRPNDFDNQNDLNICRRGVNSQLDSCNAFPTDNEIQGCRDDLVRSLRTQTIDAELLTTTGRFADSDCEKRPLDRRNCGIVNLIWIITDALTVLVGVVVVMTIIIGGIEYSAAGSNPQAVAKAKRHITRALLALLVYTFLFAALNWLIPGGTFLL